MLDLISRYYDLVLSDSFLSVIVGVAATIGFFFGRASRPSISGKSQRKEVRLPGGGYQPIEPGTKPVRPPPGACSALMPAPPIRVEHVLIVKS